jgi:hypothetical protein
MSKKEKKEVVKAQIITLDASGKEVGREDKGRGRPPKGAVRKDGNFYVTEGANEKVTPKYIYLNGKTEDKGRGRPKPNFTKNSDGNWVENAPVVVTAPTATTGASA